MTLEAKPSSNDDLNEICYPEGAYLDAPAALEALATVVDDLVYNNSFEEIEAAHKVASEMFHAQWWPPRSPEHAEKASKAAEQFNRLGCEDLRFLLTTLVHYFVDTDEVNAIGLLSSYLLNRKSGGEARLLRCLRRAAVDEAAAKIQLRRLKAAAESIEDNR